MKKIKVSIIGANGYTGAELMGLLAEHKFVDFYALCSRSNAGTKVCDMYPALQKYKDYCFSDINIQGIAKNSDAVFLCLPHGQSAKTAKELTDCNAHIKIIDLSADFRYNDLALYEKTYKTAHPCPTLLKKAVYGLTELNAEKIKKANIVGNPGCYTTCSILSLFPLLKEKVISDKGIIIDAKSGVSGAGRKEEIEYNFNEIDENFKAYAVAAHRHTTEIEENLSAACKSSVNLTFTPHLLPLKRGILATIYTDLLMAEDDVLEAYLKYYKNEPFVIINKNGVMPELKNVRGSNFISIGFKADKKTGKLIIVACIDNLIKGASGQAVENMNIMFGFDRTEGLPTNAKYL